MSIGPCYDGCMCDDCRDGWSDLTHEQFRRAWARMTEEHRDRVRAKASYEAMSLWAVVNEWPSLRGEA